MRDLLADSVAAAFLDRGIVIVDEIEKSAEARKAKSPTTIYATEALEFLRARRQANPKDSSGNIAEGMKDKFKGSVSMWWRYIADAEAEGLVPEQKP